MQGHAQWETVFYNNNNLPNLEAVAFTTPEYGLAVGADGVGGIIMRTEDGGRSWSEVLNDVNDVTFKDLQFINSTTAVAVGRKIPGTCTPSIEGLIAVTKNYGATWELFDADNSLNAIHFPTSNVGYAVGNCGTVYKTMDGGQEWTPYSFTGVGTDLRSVHFISEEVGFVAGDFGVFLKSINGGTTWDPVPALPGNSEYEDIIFTSQANGYLLSGGSLFWTNDGGGIWTPVAFPMDASSLFFVNDSEGYAAGKIGSNEGRIWKTTDGGTSWYPQHAGLPSSGEFGEDVNDVFFLNENTGFAVGNNQFYRTNTGGETLNDVQFVTGNIIHDLTDNCEFDAGEPGLEGWIIEANNGTTKVLTTSNDLGNYFLTLPIGNDYEIRAIAPNSNWNPSCALNNAIDLTSPFDTLELNIPVQRFIDCPVLSVDVSTSALTHCADNEYTVHYCNLGTETATEAYVELDLHEDLSINSSSLPYTLIGENRYQFDLDDVAIGDSGTFYVTALLDCTAALVGQTDSVKAHIYPDDFCDSNWTGATLNAKAVCRADSVTFTITNIGAEAMQLASDFIVIEDHVLLQVPEVDDLEPNDSTTFTFYPNGKTLRLEINQHPDHPGERKQAVTVEGCSTNNNGNISMGYVTQFPEHDGNTFVSIDCQQSTTTTNNAMKKAYPKGYGVEYLTEANIDLDYHIYFQNTGTDTVYTVIIQDTLSQWLDASSIRPGTASHPYDFSLYGNGIVRMVLSDIQLPPGNVNEPASRGFVKFRVQQLADNVPGTSIDNTASVVFDYGVETATDETINLIEDDFLLLAPPVAINGVIENGAGDGVNNVQMSLTNYSDDIITDEMGAYEFPGLSTDSTYVIRPEKNTNLLNGVDALDLYLIAQHIVGDQELDSPYKMIAADVNRSGHVSTIDIVELQEVILLLDTVFPNSQSWRFVESHYTFPNPVNPLAGTIPDAFLLNNPDTDNQIQFTGVKIGDVDNTANPILLTNNDNDTNVEEPLELHIDDVELQQGNYYDIPVYVNNTADLLAYQFAIDFDAEALEYIDLQTDAATKMRSDNFGFSFLELGVITVCWFDQSTQETTYSTSAAENKSLLFNLRFLAKESTTLSNLLALNGDFVSAKAYERKGELEEKSGKLIPTISFNSLDQNLTNFDQPALGIFPNPANHEVSLHYQVDAESYIEIKLLNALGQQVKKVNFKERRTKGTYLLNTSDVPEGTYFIHFQANEKTTLRKLVKLNH